MKFITNSVQQVKTMDRRSFLIGLGCVGLFYGLLFAYMIIFSASTIEKLESTLASQIVVLEKHTPPPTETKTENPEGHTITSIPEGLYESAKSGSLPVIRTKDNLSSFNAFKKDFIFPVPYKPMLSFVISDFGLSQKASETALEILPSEVSYSLSPYADMADEWVKRLRQADREVWLNVPFENIQNTTQDQGVFTILSRSSLTKNQNALHQAFGISQGYPGIASHTDELFLQDSGTLKKIIDEMFGRGLGYLEINPEAPSFIHNAALSKNAPYIKADIVLNMIPGSDPFAKLEKILNTQGYAVAVVPNYPENIKRLAAWIIKVGQADYVLAPVSAMYERPLHQSTNSTISAEPSITPHPLESTDMVAPPHTSTEH